MCAEHDEYFVPAKSRNDTGSVTSQATGIGDVSMYKTWKEKNARKNDDYDYNNNNNNNNNMRFTLGEN
jgi:hypothetical protein